MFKSDTVFVIGAGASSEFGLPLGTALAKTISNNLTLFTVKEFGGSNLIDHRFADLIRWRFKDDPDIYRQALQAVSLIQRGILHAQSIDAFIDMHSDKPLVALVGKLQIALCILRAERNSTLMVDRSDIYNKIDFDLPQNAQSWLRVFTEILLEKAKVTDLSSIGKGISVICFNYDRCLEHYLIGALQATLGITYPEAHKVVYSMDIIHPYGSLGMLPSVAGGTDGLDYGADFDNGGVDIWPVAEGLSTFTEELSDKERLGRIREATSVAQRLVCLGFGFQSQNVQLLQGQGGVRVATAISTGFGLHEVAVREVRNRLTQILSGSTYDRAQEAIMLGVGCGDLLRFNRLVLSRS